MAGLPHIAATLGGWSARHRLVAISGWLVLVIGLTLLGSAVGQVTMTAAEYGTGESGRAMWVLADAGIKDPAAEHVMVHGAAAMGAFPARPALSPFAALPAHAAAKGAGSPPMGYPRSSGEAPPSDGR